MTGISFIQLNLIFIMYIYIIYNKFIIFLSYFNDDSEYLNSIRYVVHQGP